MNTRFQTGDKVTGNVQGLQAGQTYTVADIHLDSTPFGTFTTYILEGTDGRRYAIGNGHLVLQPAGAAA